MRLDNFLITIAYVALSIENAQGYCDYTQITKNSNTEIYESQEWKNLLHYDGNKSVINSDSNFFLSPVGHYNPKEEYLATIQALLNNQIKDDNHAICRYPARFNYILNKLNLSKKDFPDVKCTKYQEYLDKVPFDNVAIVFAAENNVSPSSMMGHTFLKIAGKNSTGYKEHAFSYFATFDETNSLRFYINVLTTGISGAYALLPYREKETDYLYNEKRSLWEFNLNLLPAEKYKLKQHLWELKGSNIQYSLISHNCNTAVVSILKTANSDFDTSSVQPFITPIEYIQELYHKQKITNIEIDPTDYNREKIKRYGVKNILEANKNTRIEISHHNTRKDFTKVKLSPVYQDIKDNNHGYFDEMESKIGELSFGYSKSNKLFLESINLLKMRSILDYDIQQDFSKHFKLSFENDLNENNTSLKPTLEFGLGVAKYVSNAAFYLMPKIGWRYNHYNNFYITPEIGTIIHLTDKTKMIASYEYYFNSRGNNRGYDGKYNFYLGQELIKNVDLYADYSYFQDANYKHDFAIGLSYRF